MGDYIVNNAENSEHDKKLLLQVFHYLQALDQLKNPVPMDINTQPWLLWFRDMPEHPTIRRGNVADNTSDDVSESDDYLLKVARPDLSDTPRAITALVRKRVARGQRVC